MTASSRLKLEQSALKIYCEVSYGKMWSIGEILCILLLSIGFNIYIHRKINTKSSNCTKIRRNYTKYVVQ